MKKVCFIIVGCLMFLACERPIAIFIKPSKDNLLVVDAWLANNDSAHIIKLSRTVAIKSDTVFHETEAKVWIEDNLGNTYNTTEIKAGHYKTDSLILLDSFDINYKLFITLKNSEQLYTSSFETFHKPVPIDKLRLIGGVQNIPITDSVLNVSFFDIPEVKNAYYWQLYKNGVLSKGENTPYTLIDKLVDGRYVVFPFTGFTTARGDSVFIEQHTISHTAHHYLSQVKKQIRNSELPLSIQARAVIGNMKNEKNPDELVLGFFVISSVSTSSLTFP